MKEAATRIHAYADKAECDVFVFSAPIQPTRRNSTSDQLLDLLLEKENRRERVSLFLTTHGGDPDSAFRIARRLRKYYKHFTVVVAGPCKSAGTLIAIGAHDIAMGPSGEFGPLDVQMAKTDELLLSGSGLDIFMSLGIIQSQAYDRFVEYLGRLTNDSDGTISTKTAANISVELINGLMTPIAAHIDPIKLGEAQRAINIAKAYANCLGMGNLKDGALDRLVEEYPCHSFVVDLDEAKNLFKSVREFTQEEAAVADILQAVVRYPATKNYSTGIFDAVTLFPRVDEPPADNPEKERTHDEPKTGGSTPDHSPDDTGGATGEGPEPALSGNGRAPSGLAAV